MKRPYFTLPLLMVVCMLLGCGQRLPKDLPPLYPCTLLIAQNGVPLERAAIILEYVEGTVPAGGQIWFPQGVTDKNGNATIRTNGRYDGAPLGRFKIVVTKLEPDYSRLGPQPSEDDPKYDAWMNRKGTEDFPIFLLVEKQYTESATTPLEIEINKGKNEAAVDVGKPARYLMQ